MIVVFSFIANMPRTSRLWGSKRGGYFGAVDPLLLVVLEVDLRLG